MRIIGNWGKGNKVENKILPASEDKKIHHNKRGFEIDLKHR